MSAADQPMTGHCLCGAVSFQAHDVETHHHACHCRMCQRWAGGPLFAATVGRIEFDDEAPIQTYASSEWAERAFCQRCGSGLFYRFKANGMMIVNVGLFDDSEPFVLSGEIFVDHKAKGFEFAGDHERLSEAETLERFASELEPPPQS